MTNLTNRDYLLSQQYHNANNLNARVTLHERFSTNPYGWFRWMFDQYDLPSNCQILELGCGQGDFWRSNLPRIPPGWDVTLSDFSAGMIGRARSVLAGARPFAFRIIDAQSIPFEAGRFDVVVANHMLYHVPDRPRALSEIRRVLKPGGVLFASTIGARHMAEIFELAYRFSQGRMTDQLKSTSEFTLESGQAQLEPFFSQVVVRRYEDGLHVTEAVPLADYILSTVRFGGKLRREALLEFIEAEMQRCGGAIDITKDSGLFIAR